MLPVGSWIAFRESSADEGKNGLTDMSRLFEALKTIRAKRDASGEYTRVEIRVREATPLRQPLPSSRWTIGIAGGLFTFFTGVIVAAFATALWWDWPTQDSAPRAVAVAEAPEAEPSRAAPAVDVTEPAAIAVVAVVAPTPEPPAASAAPLADQPAIANQPAAVDPLPKPLPAGDFWVQLGAFKEHDNADRFHAHLLRKQPNAVIRAGRPKAPSWVVAVGPYPDERAASEARIALAREGLPGFVIRGDR